MSIEERYKSQYFGSEMDERLGKAHHSGSSDPDSGTVGVLGQRYFNTATGDVFVCTAVSGSVYTWENKIGAVENIISSHMADTENPHAVTVDQMGGSNKNLLHNWYFPKPVNGRGQSSYSGNGSMTIDRWKLGNASACALMVNSASVTTSITNSPNYGNWMFYQLIENPKLLIGNTYTLSVDIASVTGNAAVFMRFGNSSDTFISIGQTPISSIGITSVTVTIPEGTSTIRVGIAVSGATGQDVTCEIVRAKLELGSVSTLANDPPADYGEQLALCQRYFRRLKSFNNNNFGVFATGGCISTTQFRFLVEFGLGMRVAPTITSNGNFRVSSWDGSMNIAVNSFNNQSFNSNNELLIANCSGLTSGVSGILQANNDTTAYIDFSADL